ncbi:MAG: membrane protein insertion efficiency factor YidD [Magnetococcales bacterium]|nr:membrane protein insertion efficiency factor YidD [Magnetococcales bacterium]
MLRYGISALILLFAQAACGEENPLIYRPLPPTPTAHPPETTWPARWLLAPLSFYSQVVSPLSGHRCPLFPSCSQYAQAALHRHGVIPGVWLAVDRLLHERSEIAQDRSMRLRDGTGRVVDTLEVNDFWLDDSHHTGEAR